MTRDCLTKKARRCLYRSPFDISHAFNTTEWTKAFRWQATSGLVVMNNSTGLASVADAFAPGVINEPPTGKMVDGQLEFSWTAPDSIGVSITAYQVHITAFSGQSEINTVMRTNQTSFLLDDVAIGNEYCASVIAQSVGGLSAESEAGCARARVSCALGSIVQDDFTSCSPCPEGFASDQESTECTPCGLGTYTPQPGMHQCFACGYGSVSLQTASTTCRLCPIGAECPNASTLITKPGHWRKSRTHDLYSVYECPVPEACIGGGAFGDDLCALGFVGPLCSECYENYFLLWTGKECRRCGTVGSHGPTIGLAVVVGVLVVSLLMRHRGRVKSTGTYRVVFRMYQVR